MHLSEKFGAARGRRTRGATTPTHPFGAVSAEGLLRTHNLSAADGGRAKETPDSVASGHGIAEVEDETEATEKTMIFYWRPLPLQSFLQLS